MSTTTAESAHRAFADARADAYAAINRAHILCTPSAIAAAGRATDRALTAAATAIAAWKNYSAAGGDSTRCPRKRGLNEERKWQWIYLSLLKPETSRS